MLSFFAKRVAVNTTTTVASAGVANVAYSAGASTYNYTLNKYNDFKKSSLFQPITEREADEYKYMTTTQLSY